jgi:3-hydroxybutyrate dehydrogenase
MADLTVEEALERYGPTPITEEQVLRPGSRLDSDATALVTGAANGIGRATALALAVNGMEVVGFDRDEAGLEAVRVKADELGAEGGVEPVVGDLTDDADCERAVERASEGRYPYRYLANVAGLQHIDDIDEYPMSRFDELHGVMLRAPTLLTKLSWSSFEAHGGVVGNMCSVHGHVVTGGKVAYNTAKFGLRGLTQSVAAEGEGHVRGFSVSTGWVRTALVARQLPETADRRGTSVEEVVRDVSLGHTRVKELMEPVDVANLFVLGFSEHARHLNGGDLLWDGGMVGTYE